MDLFIYLFIFAWSSKKNRKPTLKDSPPSKKKKKKKRWCKFTNWGHVTLDANSKDMVCLESFCLLVSSSGLD